MLLVCTVATATAFNTLATTPSGVLDRSRTATLQMGPLLYPFESFIDGCPLTGSRSRSTPKTESDVPPADLRSRALQALDDAEQAFLQQAGIEQPLACTAAETAIKTLLRGACDELGGLTVKVKALSSAELVLRGQLMSATATASGVVAAGLRISSVQLSSDGVDIDIGNVLTSRPPNLRRAAEVGFSCRLTEDDLNRSPIVFAALQELLRELLRTGVSAAIGGYLPEGRVEFTLKSVETTSGGGGQLILVADAEGTQADGRLLRLQGMRVQVTPMASDAGLLILDSPKLLSTFEGFGAKVEVGLPFLRAAGVPLPRDVTLRALTVDSAGLTIEGAYIVKPLDYDALLYDVQAAVATAAAAQSAERRAQGSTPDVVSVDVASAVDVEAEAEAEAPRRPRREDGLSDEERAALRLPPAPL